LAGKKKRKKEDKAGPKPIEAPEFFKEIEDREKLLNVPKTLLKKEEWGLLTILNLLLAGIFPAYFVNILLVSFFTEVGHLWTTHLTEKERKRLTEFEKEFRVGYEMEQAGNRRGAVKVYESLIPKYADNPKISKIARERADSLKGSGSGGKK